MTLNRPTRDHAPRPAVPSTTRETIGFLVALVVAAGAILAPVPTGIDAIRVTHGPSADHVALSMRGTSAPSDNSNQVKE